LLKPDPGILEAVFFNVGKADAAYVRPPESKGFLVDGGLKNEFFDSGTSVIMPFLRWKGVNSLDAVFVSHADMDHIGGLFSTLTRIPADSVYFNHCEGSGDEIRKLFEIASAKGAALRCLDGFYPPVRFGDVTVQFLNPPVKKLRGGSRRVNLNDTSLCMRIEYGHVSFLFTGDLERDGEAALLASGKDLRATILKVGHHGSKTSSGRSFLEAVQPKYAIISAGAPPYQRGPSKEVRERLQSAGAEVLWTGRDGAVIVETDGCRVSVRTGNTGTRSPDRKEVSR
jgi:competence protein ComEC